MQWVDEVCLLSVPGCFESDQSNLAVCGKAKLFVLYILPGTATCLQDVFVLYDSFMQRNL